MYNAAVNRLKGLEATQVNEVLINETRGSGNLYGPQPLIKMFWSFPLPSLVMICQIIASILTSAGAMSCQSLPSVLGDRMQCLTITYNSDGLREFSRFCLWNKHTWKICETNRVEPGGHVGLNLVLKKEDQPLGILHEGLMVLRAFRNTYLGHEDYSVVKTLTVKPNTNLSSIPTSHMIDR